MKTLKNFSFIFFLLALPICAEEQSAPPVPAGNYVLDKYHATLIFAVDHLGFSRYTASFSEFDAELKFDPKKPAASSVTVTVNPKSLSLPNPPPGFTKTLLGKQWLDAEQYPRITFRSTDINLVAPETMLIHGVLNLHGVSQTITLKATYNGGYAGHPMDPHARIGFSATGSFNRSDFGIDFGIPAPGSKMGVSDNVDIVIEAEFSGPPLESK